MMRVQMLGRFSVFTPQQEIVFPTIKVRLLAAYLFWYQGRWVRRDLLRDMLWGDTDAARASGSLRTGLYLLKRTLESSPLSCGVLEARREAVRVTTNRECLIDARLFEEKATEGLQKTPTDIDSLMAAATLYQGDFLEDLDGEWCHFERQRLSFLHLAVLRTLVGRLADLGLYEAALTYASRWIMNDPFDEAAHRALMLLYHRLGQPAKVVEQYEQCRIILQRELGVEPGEDTQRLAKELVKNANNKSPLRCRLENTTVNGKKCRKIAASSAQAAFSIIPEKLSRDPLRNARLLLASGEALALLGETEEGIDYLEKALNFYDKSESLAAKARLLLAEALIWLSIPLTPRMDRALREKGLAYTEQAIAYYRDRGPLTEFLRALQLGAETCWLMGLNRQAEEMAQEGLGLAMAMGEREAEARFFALLGMSLREEYRLEESLTFFDKAVELIPYLSLEWEVLWVLFQRGILSYIIGNLEECEYFLREALTLCRLNPFSSLMAKIGESMTYSMMIVLLHYQDNSKAIERFLKAEMGRYNPEPFVYLNRLFAAGEQRETVLPGIEGWLRSRLDNLPAPMVACTIRSVVEEMLAAGFYEKAAYWSETGVQLGQARGWGGFEALFYCYQGVAMLKLGKTESAEKCLVRARQKTVSVDRWAPAWLARLGGLLARARGDEEEARKLLQQSRELFLELGSHYDARQVSPEIG